MKRILMTILALTVIVTGCAAEPTATPVPPSPTEVIATPVPTDTPVPPSPTIEPTMAPTDTPEPTPTPVPITGTVKSTLNVREQPSTRAKLLGVLQKDDVVTLVGRTEDKQWLQINYPLGETTTAWVIAERIDTTANLDALPAITAVAATPEATQAAIATTAPGPTAVEATPAATPVAQTPIAAETQPAPAQATPTAAVETAQPPVTTDNPPGSLIFDSFENGTFNIYRVRADGSGIQLLIAGGSEPALSPDGQSIAYRMRRGIGGLGIGIANLNGQLVSTLTTESPAGYPTWSPDGNNIAYHILPSGRLSGVIQRIGVGPDNTPTIIGIGVRPAWQPGVGTFVLFDGCKGAADCGSLLTQNAFQADPDNPTVVVRGIAGAWSPDAALIAFQDQDENGFTQIYIANADGTNKRQVTKGAGTRGMPIWSADGRWLFYRFDQAGAGWAIYAIRVDGTGERKIVDSNVNPEQWVYAKLAIGP